MNNVFNLCRIQRICKEMLTFFGNRFRFHAVAGAMLWVAGCADRDAVQVRLHSRPPPTQGMLHLEITAEVAGAQSGLRYKWFAVAGGCNPQESPSPTTLFKFADGATRDRVSVEVWRGSKLVGRSEMDVKLDEIQAQLAAVEHLPKDLQIEITSVPPYEPKGGPETRAGIAGKVGGKIPASYNVVLYAAT